MPYSSKGMGHYPKAPRDRAGERRAQVPTNTKGRGIKQNISYEQAMALHGLNPEKHKKGY